VVDSSSRDSTHVISSSDRQLVIHLTQVLVAMATDRKRMRRRVFSAGEAVVAVGDGGDPRPHVTAEKVHVLDVAGSVARHDRTEAVSAIIKNTVKSIIILTPNFRGRNKLDTKKMSNSKGHYPAGSLCGNSGGAEWSCIFSTLE